MIDVPSVVKIVDYIPSKGWNNPASATTRAQECCARIEEGKILFFDHIPFEFPAADREFLLSQKQSGSRVHKNVSYRPLAGVIRGSAAATDADTAQLQDIMRRYSQSVVSFLGQILTPYASQWALDYASYRPEEEKGRDIAFHKRNDLLHVDSFPTRPTRGGRILRCFTNINPAAARVWNITEPMPVVAKKYAATAGLSDFAARGDGLEGLVRLVKRSVGMKAPQYSKYDRFMLHFHDFLKENQEFQQTYPKTRIEFPPMATWICYTDSVPHAVLSGQYALEQTFIIPIAAMVKPDLAPIRVLENLAGRALAA